MRSSLRGRHSREARVRARYRRMRIESKISPVLLLRSNPSSRDYAITSHKSVLTKVLS